MFDLDRMHLKVKYKGILLTAMAIDSNGILFPLAFVMNVENDDNWFWFLKMLNEVVETHVHQFLQSKVLIFLLDCQKGLLEIVKEWRKYFFLCNSLYDYCLKHFGENFYWVFKNSKLCTLL